MRERLAGAVLVVVATALIASLGAASATAACPNEAFRTGPAALLPECRAYEMVTPVEKESGFAVVEFAAASVVAPSGDEILFNAPSAYAGAEGNLPSNPYIGGRSNDDWSVTPIGGPQPTGDLDTAQVLGIDRDLDLAFAISKEALAPGAIPFGSNAYVRDNRTGTYTTVVALPGNEAFAEWTSGTTPFFVDAAADFSDILLTSTRVLAPGAVAGAPNLYEYRDGVLGLAAAEAEPAATPQAIPNVMSADGNRFFFKRGGAIYLHRRGVETSEPVSETAGGLQTNCVFVGATPDGETAFFVVPAGSLYRFEAAAPAGERVTNLTPYEGSAETYAAYMGEDPTTVYLASKSLLTPDAEPRPQGTGIDLYVWHGEPGQVGGLRYIGKTEAFGEGNGLANAYVSPNGRFFGFDSVGEVTADAVQDPAGSCPGFYIYSPPGPCVNVFVYSADSGSLLCASCTGSPETADSHLGSGFSATNLGPESTPLLDDGTVFFETPNAISPRDGNGALDVYAQRGDTAQLISTGTDIYPSTFIGASADGSNIFFQTAQPLVGRDDDRLADLYDARVDGGLPQEAPATPPSCSVGGDCRAGETSAPPPTRTGTATVGGAGEGAPACGAIATRAKAARKRSRTLAGRAKAAKGGRAKALRRRAAREAATARRLGRRAGACAGGGR